MPFGSWNERSLVLVLCAVAAVRVFVFSAAFPFFNNLDEQAHFDLVIKYSRGWPVQGFEPYCAESAHYLARYQAPEYLNIPDEFPGGKFPRPVWTAAVANVSDLIQKREDAWESTINLEGVQPPLYYWVAGLWLRVGRLLGVAGGHLLYWIRFVNVPVIVGVVWLSFVTARMIFPERRVVRLGVPLLAAFLPQDAFYSIQNDVLSPLCFGVAFICLLSVLDEGSTSAPVAVLGGLALAGSGFVKEANLPLIAVVVLAVVIRACGLIRAAALHAALPKVLFLLSVILPIGAWLAWNRFTQGQFTVSAGKTDRMGWTLKPLGDWWHHPIFTPAGLWTFWSEFSAKFWRGGFVWEGQPLASPTADAFYSLSSALFPALGVLSIRRRFAGTTDRQSRCLWIAFWGFVASVAFLALVSIAFAFGKWPAPSREHPYLTAGRLASGALIPFLLLYVRGMDWALSGFRNEWAQWLALAGIVLLVTISEISVNSVAFGSEYNWFHLIKGAT